MKDVTFHRLATGEMIESARYYERRREGLGFRFLHAVEDTCRRIEELPESGAVLGGEVRKRAVARFPYNVLYRIEDEHIFILAIMHHRRKPGYWKRRH